MKWLSFLGICMCCFSVAQSQVNWVNADPEFGDLPAGFHVYKTTDSLNGEPFVAYYASASLSNKNLKFTTDTTHQRRITPRAYYEKNDQPLLVVNSTFFSFATNQNLNLVVKEGKTVGYNIHNQALKGKDSGLYRHPFHGAIGINHQNEADIAWVFSDSSDAVLKASQKAVPAFKDSDSDIDFKHIKKHKKSHSFKKWKVETAVGGGPVLVQNGVLQVSNNEEYKFAGKAINDKHPRTVIGYTKNQELIVMVIQGRMPGIAAGATLTEAALLMQELNCVEALNLDGGGSSCMLINGKETIIPSAKGEQRPIPAVFMIQELK